MPYQTIYVLDRASFLLDAQLLSSLTSGNFTGSSSSVLGTQTWNMPAGYKAILTIEQEQILLSAMSITGGTITCTIDTRGYNGTVAATHAAGAVIELHLTKAHFDGLQNEVSPMTQGFILQSAVTTVSAANQHTIAGNQTAIFTVGRTYLFKISSTWYRCVIRSSSYGGGNTTVNLTGDGLPASGTIVSAGFEFIGSLNKPVDYLLVKEATNTPADAPPSGYCWLFAKGKAWYLKDSAGVSRRLSIVQASASSSGGVLTLDWSLADVYDCTLTENITGVTHQNGADGEMYVLRLKQHASAAKIVALGTSGGTRYSNDITGYTVTPDLSAIDVLSFRYNGTDAKYDFVNVTKGFQASPVASSASAWDTLKLGGDGSDGAVNMDGTNTYASFASKASSVYTLLRDVYATTFVVAVGVTLNTAGFKIYANASITATGIIQNLGGNGATGSPGSSGGVGGSGGPAGSTGGANNGGTGAYGGSGAGYVTGGAAPAGSNNLGAAGANGGGGSGSSGGAGGTAGTPAVHPRLPIVAETMVFGGSSASTFKGGTGGGGGGITAGGGDSESGGGGGGGGGIVWMSSPSITVSSGGYVKANGGTGANGAGTTGSAGGGGGGGGGFVFIRYKTTYTNSGTVQANGGSGGSGQGAGSSAGGTGTNGTVFTVQIS